MFSNIFNLRFFSKRIRSRRMRAAGAPAKRRRRWAAPLGLAIFAFAIIGVFYMIGLGVQTYQTANDDSAQKVMFEEFIGPAVMVDFPPFENTSIISSVKALEAAMWSTMMTYNDGEVFVADDFGRQIIPTSVIDEKAKALFGKDITLHYVDFGEVDAMFEYDSLLESYHAPIFGATNLYTPIVESIKQNGNTFTLKVGYISSDAQWAEDKNGSKIAPAPEKYMIYKLIRIKAPKVTNNSSTALDSSLDSSSSSDQISSKTETYYISSIQKET